MNAGMKDMLNVMSKFLAMGMPLDEVIARSTWNPAREIKQEASAISPWARRRRRRAARRERPIRLRRHVRGADGGNERLVCELTLRDGKVLYDLNGLSRPDWRSLPADYRQTGDARWDGITPAAHPEVAMAKSNRRAFLKQGVRS